MRAILAIDPGNVQSAYVVMDAETYKPYKIGKVDNEEMLRIVSFECANAFYNQAPVPQVTDIIIENVTSYGMPVGREVFDTCIWIGRFTQQTANHSPSFLKVDFILRSEEKLTLCHDSKAKDSNIRRALIDRFAQHDLQRGTGTKKSPDWFYGFAADIWAAYAVGVTWLDKKKEEAW